MTIIAFAVNKEGVFISSSDILISDNSLKKGDREILPLQYGLFNEASSTLGREIASKAVIFDNYLLQWAGSVYSVKILIKELKKKQPKNREEFLKIAKTVEEDCKKTFKKHGIKENSAKFAAILNHNDGNICWYSSWNANVKVYDENIILSAGTGEEDFLDAVEHLQKSGKDLTNTVIQSIFKLSIIELTDKKHSYDVYGGGYEFFTLKEGGGYRRAGYTLCEVSHYDSLGKKFNNYWFISRIIKCTPTERGSKFETILLPGPNTKENPIIKDFFALEVDYEGSAEDSKMISEELDFGACLVIDQKSMVGVGKKPFVDFTINGNKFSSDFKHDQIQDVIAKYVEMVGKDPGINSEEDLKKIVCGKCSESFVEVFYVPKFDSDGNLEEAKWLCEKCFKEEAEAPSPQSR